MNASDCSQSRSLAHSPCRAKPLHLWLTCCFSLMLVVGLTACQGTPQATADGGAAAEQLTSVPPEYADRPQLSGTAILTMTVVTEATGEGTVTLELNGDLAPLTAGNFVDLVQKGFYDGLTFHRVVNDPVPFVVQGGDPLGNGTGGYTDSVSLRKREIPLEITVDGEDKPRYNTLLDQAQITQPPALPHRRAALAMARSQAPNSASSQFYITLSDQPVLDGRYAVFGYITEGMDVVDAIQVGDTIGAIKVIEGADNLFVPE
ncbi:MAG: peptidylprolyl isomerase [Cyanobacteria bacterium P01_F01_bin.33]